MLYSYLFFRKGFNRLILWSLREESKDVKPNCKSQNIKIKRNHFKLFRLQGFEWFLSKTKYSALLEITNHYYLIFGPTSAKAQNLSVFVTIRLFSHNRWLIDKQLLFKREKDRVIPYIKTEVFILFWCCLLASYFSFLYRFICYSTVVILILSAFISKEVNFR